MNEPRHRQAWGWSSPDGPPREITEAHAPSCALLALLALVSWVLLAATGAGLWLCVRWLWREVTR